MMSLESVQHQFW